MALTVAEIKTQVQALMDTPGTSAISSSEWLTLIDLADDYVWRCLVKNQPDYWLTETRIVWPSNVDKLDISGAFYLNTKPYKLISLDFLPSNAAISTTNTPVRCLPMTFAERPIYLAQSPNTSTITNIWYSGSTPYDPMFRFVLKDSATLYVAPIPPAGTVFNVGYIAPRAKITATTDTVLNGKADDFGRGVTLYAAFTINNRKGGANAQIAGMWKDFQTELENTAAKREEAGPSYINYEPWGGL